MAASQLRLLGGFELRDSRGTVVKLPSRKAQALIAYLGFRPGNKQPRTRLAGLLWSDRSEDQARASLRQCLSAVNKQITGVEPTLLSIDRQSVAINVSPSSVDVLEFERLARDERPDALLRSIELYAGDFLDGVELRDHAGDEWLASERERLRSLLVTALIRAVEAPEGTFEPGTIIDCAKRLLDLDPLQEAAYRALMLVYNRRGERGVALRVYRDCCEALADELDVSPGEETLRVYHKIAGNGTTSCISSAGEQAPLPRITHKYDTSQPALIVLPFQAMASSPTQQYLADGVTEDIITALTRFRELLVLNWRTSFAASVRSRRVRELGEELGIRYAVTGSIREMGERIRVTVTLLDAESERESWAESYDREANDLFALQDEIVRLIVITLVGQIEDADREIAARKNATDMKAYDHVLRGRAALSRWTKEGVVDSRSHFRRALDMEHESAPAHTGLARSYLMEYWGDWTTDAPAALERAFDYASRAVLLDSADHGAHQILSMCYLNKRQYDMALAHIEKSTTLNPNDYSGFCNKSWLLALAGKPEEGIRCSIEGLRRNPLARGPCLMNAGVAHYTARYYEDAVREFSECISYPLWRLAGLAASYAQLGEIELARYTSEELLGYARKELEADFGDDASQWLGYWRRVFPFKSPDELEHLLSGFRKAGLPA